MLRSPPGMFLGGMVRSLVDHQLVGVFDVGSAGRMKEEGSRELPSRGWRGRAGPRDELEMT